ncbi:MAG: metallophosphoesterase [Verrucomicrobiales bacterium]|nr:metallophosphoesterase [Verrucomicrobiales bacterium]
MRIQILSDLHIEFGEFQYPKTGADLVILAGDTHTKLNGVKWAIKEIPEVPVLYILGNHEFYGAKFPRLIEKLKIATQGSNVRILEEESIEIGVYRFFGATLWTDMALHGDIQTGSIEALQMNDYKKVAKTLPIENSALWIHGHVTFPP